MAKMQFCSNGTEFTHVWIDKGINRCFFDTVTSALLCLFILIFGIIQCSVYGKYAKNAEKYLTSNLGSVVQILLTLILFLESLTHIIVKDMLKESGGVTGVDVLTFLCLAVSWACTLKILSLERRNILPTIKTKGHGLVLLIFWAMAFLRENLAFISWWNHSWWWYSERNTDHAELVLWIIRYSCTCLLFVLGIIGPGLPKYEYRTLLMNESAGECEDKTGDEKNEKANSLDDTQLHQHKGSTWVKVWQKIKMMLPYIWPMGSWWRQLIVVFCLFILGIGRAINVFVPIYNKNIVNSLIPDQSSSAGVDKPLTFRWDFIVIYCTLLFLKGSAAGTGFLSNLQTFLWIPVEQYTTRRVQVKLFSHLHCLSLGWHLKRKTGEILRVVDRGTNSINNLLDYTVFNILPTIADIVIAIVYFVTEFNYVFGLVVFIAMAMYITVTVMITEWRTKYRREMNRLDNEAESKAVDSLINFETVKYYGASEFEVDRYNKAILNYQIAEWKATASLNLMNTAQNIVVTSGSLAGCLLCAYAVVHSVNGLHLTVGDYVLFGSYIMQLYGPLTWLGTLYRMIQTAFIDMENMFELLDVGLEVKDEPDAKDLQITMGKIEFKDVQFHYESSKPILKGITFTVPAGQTYALVGHSGSGKSTIIRLLFRFYDVQAGSICIDDQDIKMVKQESLRRCIGVVPQDTVLFNQDIMYNIRYGRVTATDEDVKKAADAADIHNRILTFPSKYETVVGERGLKLSGGEKQRVAIARTLLKAPAIVLLDEATSALDTKTERNIQSSLSRVCENRTTIIVAHRLSTIIHADMILVMSEGEIIERGMHDELIARQGHYYEMWQQQLTKLEDDNSSSIINGSVTNGTLSLSASGVDITNIVPDVHVLI